MDAETYAHPNEFYTVPPELVDVHVKHITEFDKSDSIIPHGEVSKKLYTDIFGQVASFCMHQFGNECAFLVMPHLNISFYTYDIHEEAHMKD